MKKFILFVLASGALVVLAKFLELIAWMYGLIRKWGLFMLAAVLVRKHWSDILPVLMVVWKFSCDHPFVFFWSLWTGIFLVVGLFLKTNSYERESLGQMWFMGLAGITMIGVMVLAVNFDPSKCVSCHKTDSQKYGGVCENKQGQQVLCNP